AKEDEEKTSFVTDKGTYCFITMPFGLKNAGATFQRLVNKIFKKQLGRNMEAYVDDLLVKSKDESAYLHDLRETLETLVQYKLRLNPKKCIFGATSGKFLGYMVSEGGISVNPKKVEAILQMHPPRSVRE
ncbi:RNA-directed DNA polymerase, partial [Salmonella enterica subsp. enterica serovar Typhi]|nr:RNA-directed DNA polymerase [Salmonella enterica subsp. enterica serovar Typhi]